MRGTHKEWGRKYLSSNQFTERHINKTLVAGDDGKVWATQKGRCQGHLNFGAKCRAQVLMNASAKFPHLISARTARSFSN